jgi:flagellar biosynthesis protein FlhF
MRMKHIVARDMKEAMQKARLELGEHAVLLRSESQQGGKGVLVTFATEEDHEPLWDDAPAVEASPTVVPIKPAAPPSAASTGYDVARDILRFHQTPEPLFALLEQGMRQARIHALPPLEAAAVLLEEAFSHCLRFETLVLAPGNAYMAVGPHGVGKTTFIAKLATQARLEKTPLTLISTDIERLGGLAALEQLAQVLGIDVVIAQSRAQLREALKANKPDHLVLIDSPGVNVYQFQEMKALGELATLDDITPVLLLPSNQDSREAEELVGVFSFLEIGHTVITKTDATRRYAGIMAALNHCNAALTHMVTSAKPGESVVALSAHHLAQLLLTYQRERQG